jgi:hypothetical protein
MSPQSHGGLAAVTTIQGSSAGTIGPAGSSALPTPTCGGLKIQIVGALPCEKVVEIAIGALRERAPDQLARGVAAIDVTLSTCPANEVPPQINCNGAKFAQLVTISFKTAPQGGPIEPSLTVAVDPVSGAVLGISNPLIR